MVDVFSLATANYFDDALAAQARLRHRVFIEQRNLDHSSWDGMEYDEFDTPAAIYFLWRDEAKIARGLIRLLPTTLPYMSQSYWPHLFRASTPPQSRHIWEVTRLCVDRDFDPRRRVRVMPEIMCAVSEYCEEYGIETIIGVTRKHLILHFLRNGVEWLGPTKVIEGEPEAAFRVNKLHMRPKWHCEKYGLNKKYLRLAPVSIGKIAA